MSDNWNILAKLLGTPGPPQDTNSSKTDNDSSEQSPAAEESSAEESSAEADSTPVAPPEDAGDSVVSDAKPPSEGEDVSAESVLSALTEAAESTQLPGFGLQEQDPELEELAAGGPPAIDEPVVDELLEQDEQVSASDELFAADEEEHESAWNDLAGELGVDANDETGHRAPTEIPVRVTGSGERKAKKRSGGFGTGLGLDLGEEPDDEVEAVADVDVDVAEPTANEIRDGIER